MIVRRLGREDADKAADLVAPLYHRRPAQPSRWAEMLDDPSLLLFVATAGDKTVGLVLGYLLNRLDGAAMFMIYELTVAAGHRRKGIATELVTTAWSAAQRDGAVEAWLVTSPDDEGAVAFYESLGATAFPAVGFEWVADT